MNKKSYSEYLDAVDIVCINCAGNENDCERCQVRRTCEELKIKFEQLSNEEIN